MAITKQNTQIIWILSGCTIVLIGALYYLRLRNLELKSVNLINNAKILSLKNNIDGLKNVLQQSQKANKDLSEKLLAAKQTS
ncbi:hypothetical protein ACFOW1_16985 [Parasediminibacterium paludis]|uniref:Uncharacterized protein n=1 Tax=Parasediminibacterium paludis TaxID=908966 RepID=A0ABV8Q2U8_9BACT